MSSFASKTSMFQTRTFWLLTLCAKVQPAPHGLEVFFFNFILFLTTYSLFKPLVWQCLSVFYEKLLELLTFPLESSYYPVFQKCCNCTAVIILTLNPDCRIWKGMKGGDFNISFRLPRARSMHQNYYELLRQKGLQTEFTDKLLRHKMPLSSRIRKW